MQELESVYFRDREGLEYPVRRADRLEENKIYRTRQGSRVRIYAIDHKNKEVHGAVYNKGRWEIDLWHADGRYFKAKGQEHGMDIQLAPPLRLLPGHKYKSRDGRPARIFEMNKGCTDTPLVGMIKDERGFWVPRIWNTDGVTKRPYGPGNDLVAEWSEG